MSRGNEIDILIPVFKNTFRGVIDFDKFNNISITFHSTAIEGGTLTLSETEVLIDKGLSPKGKPFIHQQMVLDHYHALTETLNLAESKTPISIDLIQQIGGLVMKNTGSVINTGLGNYDSSKGDLRLNNVRAGDHYFVNYDKVKPLLSTLVAKLNTELKKVTKPREILNLAFTAHYDLVLIHPFADGNGRASRLLMNYIQHYHGIPVSTVFSEDRKEYIDSISASVTTKSLNPFLDFMLQQYEKFLRKEITSYQTQHQNIKNQIDKDKSQGYSFVF